MIKKISLLVATHSRRSSLEQVICSFTQQNISVGKELVIVDNNSQDDTADYLNNLKHPNIICLFERQPGKSRSLNRAMKAATGDLWVFTDDDVIADSNWLQAIIDGANAYPDIAVFGGKILLDQHSQIPKWLKNAYNLKSPLCAYHNYGDSDGIYPPFHYPFGPNMAVRRQAVISNQAQWPEDFGPGTPFFLSDESRFLEQISAPYAKSRMYLAKSIVYHRVEEQDITLSGATKRVFFTGYLGGDFLAKRKSKHHNQALDLPNTSATHLQILRTPKRKISSWEEAWLVFVRALGYFLGHHIKNKHFFIKKS